MMTSSLRRMVEDIHSACWAGQLLLVQTDLCGTIHATVETDRTALLDERYGDVTPTMIVKLPLMRKGVLFVVLAIALMTAWFGYSKYTQAKREVSYRAALAPYKRDLRVGTDYPRSWLTTPPRY